VQAPKPESEKKMPDAVAWLSDERLEGVNASSLFLTTSGGLQVV